MLEVIDSVPAYTLDEGDTIKVAGSLVTIVEYEDRGDTFVVYTDNDQEVEFSAYDRVDIYGA